MSNPLSMIIVDHPSPVFTTTIRTTLRVPCGVFVIRSSFVVIMSPPRGDVDRDDEDPVVG